MATIVHRLEDVFGLPVGTMIRVKQRTEILDRMLPAAGLMSENSPVDRSTTPIEIGPVAPLSYYRGFARTVIVQARSKNIPRSQNWVSVD